MARASDSLFPSFKACFLALWYAAGFRLCFALYKALRSSGSTSVSTFLVSLLLLAFAFAFALPLALLDLAFALLSGLDFGVSSSPISFSSFSFSSAISSFLSVPLFLLRLGSGVFALEAAGTDGSESGTLAALVDRVRLGLELSPESALVEGLFRGFFGTVWSVEEAERCMVFQASGSFAS